MNKLIKVAPLKEHIKDIEFDDLQKSALYTIINSNPLFSIVNFENIYSDAENKYTFIQSSNAEFMSSTGTIVFEQKQHVDKIKILLHCTQMPRVEALKSNVVSIVLQSSAKKIANKILETLLTSETEQAFCLNGLPGLIDESQSFVESELKLNVLEALINKVENPKCILMSNIMINNFLMLNNHIKTIFDLNNLITVLPNYKWAISFKGIPIISTGYEKTDEIYCVGENLMFFFSGPSLIDVAGPLPIQQSDMVEYQVVCRIGLSLKSKSGLAKLKLLAVKI